MIDLSKRLCRFIPNNLLNAIILGARLDSAQLLLITRRSRAEDSQVGLLYIRSFGRDPEIHAEARHVSRVSYAAMPQIAAVEHQSLPVLDGDRRQLSAAVFILDPNCVRAEGIYERHPDRD